MKPLYLAAVLLTMLGLVACDKQPVVVNVPATPTPAPVAVSVPVPGPAGPQGVAGNDGSQGAPGATGKPGEGTTVIVLPAASTPAN